ncbi:MAG: hypothetical protein Q8P24_08035 [Desulfobacterales bacterium]|nr:hypothetical protein [Desulfobacterales bacterium]
MSKMYFRGILFFAVFFLLFTGLSAAATIQLSSGWNLVSARVEITAAVSLSDAASFTSVWKWKDGGWAVYLPGETDGGAAYATSKGFAALATLNPGEGFWVNAAKGLPLTVSGTDQTDSVIATLPGWNLKGLVTANSINVGSLFSDAAKFASVWKWTGSSWSVYLPGESPAGTYADSKGFAQLSTIGPGEGFWVNASAATEVVAEPPVIAGVVTYPKEEVTAGRAALYAAGLMAGTTAVEMPPTPGATVKIYAADDTKFEKPLAEVKTDAKGNYSFVAENFDNPATPEVEIPPQIPVIVRAEFISPIDPTKKVAIGALLDPTDNTKKGQVDVNPLTAAIAQKVKDFVESTFKIQITQEIMAATRTFIDLIATQVKAQGLTQFVETDVQIGSIKNNVVDETFVPDVQNLANRVIDKGTGGLFESMESRLIEKAESDASTLGAGAVLDDAKKMEHFIKFFASLGFGVQAGVDSPKVIFFLPTPPSVPDNQIPGVQMYNDRAFRQIDPALDLSPDKFTNVNPGLIFQIKHTLDGGPVMSHAALLAVANAAKAGGTTTLTQMASVVKDKFVWKTRGVQMINGIPIFSNQDQTPSTGADVSASALISKLTGQLGATPKEIAADIAGRNYYIVRMADKVINQKVHQIQNDPGIVDKKAAMDAFFQGLQTGDDFKALVQSSEEFQREVENLSRRVFAAIEPELYGQVLSASTQLKIKTSFLLMMLIIDRDYRVDDSKSWFKTRSENGISWVEPRFDNTKWLEPKQESPGTTSNIIGRLIGAQITDGAAFEAMVQAFHQALQSIPDPEQFKMEAGMIANVSGVSQNQSVTVSAKVKNYDGTAMANMGIQLKYFDPQKAIQDAGSATTDQNGNFTFANVTAGRPYEFRFTGNSFIFPFFVGGFQADMNMGEIMLPPPAGMGGPKGFPGISLWVDQHFFNPMNPQDPNNGKKEGVDFSNFNTEKPFIVFSGSNQGSPDLFWTSKNGLSVNPALAAGLGKGIASLGTGQNHQHGLGSGPVIDHVFTPAELAGTAPITIGGATFTLSWSDSVALPQEDNAVYVVRDAADGYYFIEVRWWDKNSQNQPNGMIDMGFAKLGSDGRLEVPKENFMGGPAMGAGGGPGPNLMFADLRPGDYLDLETGMMSPPAQEKFGHNAEVAGKADVRWLADFYDTYWANETNWDTRNANLSKSNRALSVINGASLSTLTITQAVAAVTPVADGTVKELVPGTMLLVATANQGSYILGVSRVERDAVGLQIIPRDKLIDGNGNLQAGVQDSDGDGIPDMLDQNAFQKDVFDDAWAQGQFQMIDNDGDGVPAQFDPNDSDPNVPNSGGSQDKDGDGLIGAADPDDNDPNKPVQGGNLDNDHDGWPKGIDPNDNDATVPGAGGIDFGGKQKIDADKDGIPAGTGSFDDPNDSNPNIPVPGGNLDKDLDGFPAGIENWINGQLSAQDNDTNPAVYPGSFNAQAANIVVTGTGKVALVRLTEMFPGAPPVHDPGSIYELGLTLSGANGQYALANLTPAQIIAAIPVNLYGLTVQNARAEILLIDDVGNTKNGPQFELPGGDKVAGVGFGFELQMNNGVWQLNELKPGTGPQKVGDATAVTVNFGPKF